MAYTSEESGRAVQLNTGALASVDALRKTIAWIDDLAGEEK